MQTYLDTTGCACSRLHPPSRFGRWAACTPGDARRPRRWPPLGHGELLALGRQQHRRSPLVAAVTLPGPLTRCSAQQTLAQRSPGRRRRHGAARLPPFSRSRGFAFSLPVGAVTAPSPPNPDFAVLAQGCARVLADPPPVLPVQRGSTCEAAAYVDDAPIKCRSAVAGRARRVPQATAGDLPARQRPGRLACRPGRLGAQTEPRRPLLAGRGYRRRRRPPPAAGIIRSGRAGERAGGRPALAPLAEFAISDSVSSLGSAY